VTWVYRQSTGELLRDGVRVASGYSGAPGWVNNPEAQALKDKGPIPRGRWLIGARFDGDTHGPACLRLVPASGTETFGRTGFLIHGDSRLHAGEHVASHGCIVIGRVTRDSIWFSLDHDLEVIE